MPRAARALAVLLIALLLPAVGSSVGAPGGPDGLIASPERGWPQWRGPRRDGVSGERRLLASWPEGGPRLLWKVEGLGRGWSSPVIAGGTLFITGDIGPDLVIRAFDLEGKPKWQATNGASWRGQYPGARACCAYSEGRLYHMNAHGRVACLDAAGGREIWAVNVLERFEGRNITWAMAENLLVDGPRVIVTAGGAKALVAALDKKDGHTLWASEPIPGDQAAYSSPVLFRFAGRRLIAGCSSRHGFGVDADTGRLLWQVPLESPFHATVATPIYGDGCLFYVSPDGPDGTLYRLHAEGQDVRPEKVWHSTIDSLTGGGLFVGGTLYAGGYRKTRAWHCLDWQTGEERGRMDDPGTGAAVWADGRLYCQCEDGQVAMLKPSPAGLEVAGRFRLVPGRVRDAWAHPVLLDGRLYLRYHDGLWCYDVRGEA